MNLKSNITKLHYDKNNNSWILKLLTFCSHFYSCIVDIRNFLYEKNILKSYKVDAKVISVGNLTTGGVGKTPVVAEIAKYYISKGEKVAILSRGYGGTLSSKNVNVISDGENIFYTAKESGDEPYWFCENVKGACVLTCSSRVKSAEYAIKNFAVSIIILDDAFQHQKIKRDVNIVLVDSEKQFGNGKLLPAGPLRESIKSLKRADKLVIMNKSTKTVSKDILDVEFNSDKIFVSDVKGGAVYNIKTGEILEFGSLITGMCAIGQPQQFYDFLKYKYNIINTITFDDHHKYSIEDIRDIEGVIVTTEKDAVKLTAFDFDNIYALKLRTELDVEALLS